MNSRFVLSLRKAGPPMLAVLLILVVWQLYADFSGIEKWLLPSPTEIMMETAKFFPELWNHTIATVKIAWIGFSAAVLAGIALSVLLRAVIPALHKPIYPLLIITQTIPIIAVAPLFVIWLGYGLAPKIVIITLVCFFPILIASLQGYNNADPAMRNYMLMIGCSRWQLFWKLEWPSAIPYMFAGLRVSTAYSVMGAVISEWLGAKEGLGHALRLYQSSFRTDRVFSCILMITAFSLVFFTLVVLLEKRMIRWRPDQRKERY
jgi:ABC-type nitrate/sulfonate/bicarbonate transport system permease component